MEDIYEIVEIFPKSRCICRIGPSHVLFLFYQIIINTAIYAEFEGEYSKLMKIYTIAMPITIFFYYFVSFSNPGYLRVSEKNQDLFNSNMKAIESQFRNGDISFLDIRLTLEESKSPSSPKKDEAVGHKRKQSVLTKDISRHYRSSDNKVSKFNGSNRREVFKSKPYHPFTDEDTVTQNTHNKKKYRNKRKMIDNSSFQSTTMMKSTTAVTHSNQANLNDQDTTFRKAVKFINLDASEDKGISKNLAVQSVQTTNQEVICDKIEESFDIKINLEACADVPCEKEYVIIRIKYEQYFKVSDNNTIIDKNFAYHNDQVKNIDDSPSCKRETTVNNFMSSVSYCSVCNVPQPSRSSHCFSCKKCVCTYDHHSIWINNCVGEQNRRSFLLALILISIQLFMGTVLTFTRLDNDSTFSAHVVLCLIISVITEMFFLPITMTMIIFQLYLACFNFTTVEIFRPERIIGVRLNSEQESIASSIKFYLCSPYRKGLLLNLKDYFCKWNYELIKWNKVH